MAKLFARKSMTSLLAEVSTDRARHRCGYWCRYFCVGRVGRALCRTRLDVVVCAERVGLRLCRAVLRGICRHDSAGRLRLHVCVRHAWRTDCVDYRLGPDAGVRDGRKHGKFRMVEPLYRTERVATVYEPAIVMPSTRMAGLAAAPRHTRSLAMATMFLYISFKFPAIVISSTAPVNSPFSIQSPLAPCE